MSYAIMRIAKVKAPNIGGVDKHNERKNKNYSNEDINTELTHLNYSLIECESYKSAINEQIKERYTSSRSIRKDAVVGVEVLFTSDKEFFDKLTPEQERLYFEKSLEFLKDFAGEKNVISAVVHKDEKTPHLHCLFTPITNDGRLHFKSFVDGKFEMQKLQDRYYNHISQYFDLERGKSAEQTKRKHLSVAEYKLETAINERELELERVSKNTEEIKSKNSDLETQKNELETQQNNINQTLKDLEEFSKSLEKKKQEKEKEEKRNQELKEKLTLENEKFLKIEDIKNSVVEKKGFLDKEVKVTLSKDEYNSLMTYAVNGEKFNNKKNEMITKFNNLVDKYNSLIKKNELLSVNLNNEKLLSSSLADENRDLENKLKISNSKNKKEFEKSMDREIYIEKLEKALPKEKVKEIKQEIENEKNSWSKTISRNKGFDITD